MGNQQHNQASAAARDQSVLPSCAHSCRTDR